MTTYTRTILLIILFLLSVFGLTIIQTDFHEEAHLAIDKSQGCSGSYISYDLFHFSGTTYSIDCPKETDPARNQLHAINEITGYQYRILFLAILFAGLSILLSISLSKGSS